MTAWQYWALFGIAAAVLLMGVPLAALLEGRAGRRRAARDRARSLRLERSARARRQIRMNLERR